MNVNVTQDFGALHDDGGRFGVVDRDDSASGGSLQTVLAAAGNGGGLLITVSSPTGDETLPPLRLTTK